MKSKDLQELAISHYKEEKKAPEIAKLLANKVIVQPNIVGSSVFNKLARWIQ